MRLLQWDIEGDMAEPFSYLSAAQQSSGLTIALHDLAIGTGLPGLPVGSESQIDKTCRSQSKAVIPRKCFCARTEPSSRDLRQQGFPFTDEQADLRRWRCGRVCRMEGRALV